MLSLDSHIADTQREDRSRPGNTQFRTQRLLIDFPRTELASSHGGDS